MFEGKNLDLKKEAEEIMKIEGRERGVDIKNLIKYAKLKKGEDGHKKIVEALDSIGYELPDTDKIDDMEWIPASVPTMYMIAMYIVFEWDENDLFEMGKRVLAFSPLTKIFIRYFISVPKTFKTAADKWNNHYDFGHAEAIEITSHSVVLRLCDFKKHQLTCYYLMGMLTQAIEFSTGSKNIQSRERKCIFKGDECHEFEFEWK
jgi:hypothetical protein